MLTLFECAHSDFCDTVWNEHFVNIAVLEPLVSDFCDTVREGSYLKNAKRPKILVTDRKVSRRKHSSRFWDILLNIPPVFFWGPHFL